MKEKHLMSNALSGAAAAAVVLGLFSTAATATEPCDDFSECKVLIEINSTDGDIGFHFLMDGDDLISALIRDPNFVTIFQDSASGALLEQKFTETFAESAEPFCKDALKEEEDDEVVTLEEFLMRWTPGTYRFEGFGDDPIPEFGFSEGTTELTYHLPAAPTDLDFDGSVISWDSGDDLGECATKDQLNVLVMGGVLPTHPEDVVVDAWEVVFEPDVEVCDPLGQLKFTIRVSGDLDDFAPLAVTVPQEYLDSLPDDTLVKIEVGAIGGEDNATFTEIFDICVNEDEGCDDDDDSDSDDDDDSDSDDDDDSDSDDDDDSDSDDDDDSDSDADADPTNDIIKGTVTDDSAVGRGSSGGGATSLPFLCLLSLAAFLARRRATAMTTDS